MKLPELSTIDFKELRKSLSLSLREVQEGTGISNAMISQIELGRVKSPGYSTVSKLLEFYSSKRAIKLSNSIASIDVSVRLINPIDGTILETISYFNFTKDMGESFYSGIIEAVEDKFNRERLESVNVNDLEIVSDTWNDQKTDYNLPSYVKVVYVQDSVHDLVCYDHVIADLKKQLDKIENQYCDKTECIDCSLLDMDDSCESLRLKKRIIELEKTTL